MNCQRCNGPLDAGYRYCKSCGLDLSNHPHQNPYGNPYVNQPQPGFEKQGLNFLLYILLIRYSLIVFFWLYWRAASRVDFLSKIYDLLAVSTDLLYIISLAVFAILAKHKKVKLFIWIFFGIEAALFIYNNFIYERLHFIKFQF